MITTVIVMMPRTEQADCADDDEDDDNEHEHACDNVNDGDHDGGDNDEEMTSRSMMRKITITMGTLMTNGGNDDDDDTDDVSTGTPRMSGYPRMQAVTSS